MLEQEMRKLGDGEDEDEVEEQLDKVSAFDLASPRGSIAFSLIVR